MNARERRMVSILQAGKDRYGYLAVKAEFEAEGTRVEEFLRLLEICRKAGVGMGLKIGGCEAVRDLIEAKRFGVEYIIAPMVETPYALSKFIDAKNKIYSEDEQQDTDFLFNLETETGYDHRKALCEMSAAPKGVDGVVFGRVDFSGSKGLPRDAINGEGVTACVLEVARECRDRKLDLVVGGGVSMEAIPALKAMGAIYLTRFETRKIIFAGSAPSVAGFEHGLLAAVEFELLWLQNKSEYYGGLAAEDLSRIAMLEARSKAMAH
jgi:methylmalonyl-CoA mutase cobalamin-binding subunit